MPTFDFGALLGGLNQGLQQGQRIRQAGQELELRRKMLDTQMKQMEFDQKRKQEEADTKRQERLMNETVAGAVEAGLTGGKPAVPGYEDEQAQMSRAPVPAQPGPTPLDWKGQAMVGAARAGKLPYAEITKSVLGSTSQESRAFASAQDALAFKDTPDFNTAFPYGARLTQTSRGWQFTGIHPYNAANATYQAKKAAGASEAEAQQAMNEVLYGGAGARAQGTVLGGAAATMGVPTPPMPGAGAPAPAPQPQQGAAPMGVGPGTTPPIAQPGTSLPLQADTAKAKAKKTGTELAEMGLPLRERAAKYIHPQTLQPASPDISEQDAIAQGYRVFQGGNPGQFVAMSRSAFNMMDRLEQLAKKLLLPETASATERGKNWSKLQQRYYAGNDPDVREFYGIMESQLATLAKAAGDAANVAVPEQQFQRKFLPDGWMSFETAKGILDSRRALLRGTLEGALGTKPVPEANFPANRPSKPAIITPRRR